MNITVEDQIEMVRESLEDGWAKSMREAHEKAQEDGKREVISEISRKSSELPYEKVSSNAFLLKAVSETVKALNNYRTNFSLREMHVDFERDVRLISDDVWSSSRLFPDRHHDAIYDILMGVVYTKIGIGLGRLHGIAPNPTSPSLSILNTARYVVHELTHKAHNNRGYCSSGLNSVCPGINEGITEDITRRIMQERILPMFISPERILLFENLKIDKIRNLEKEGTRVDGLLVKKDDLFLPNINGDGKWLCFNYIKRTRAVRELMVENFAAYADLQRAAFTGDIDLAKKVINGIMNLEIPVRNASTLRLIENVIFDISDNIDIVTGGAK